MNIYIAGAGQVGFHLAQLLSQETHDVTVIDSDPDKLEQVDHTLDVSTVLGNAASIMVLQEAQAGAAELFVAATGSDATNLIAAAAAKGLGAGGAVARVQHAPYIESGILYEKVMDIDYVLSPEALVALEIANYIETPGLVAAEDFTNGRVQMRQVRALQSPTVDGRTLKDVFPPGSGVLLAVISRGNDVLIPHGDTIVEPGDLVALVGEREKMAAAQQAFQPAAAKLRNVFVMGGGTIGMRLAQALEKLPVSVKVFDRNLVRCHELAAQLKKAKVVHRDVTSRAELGQERVASADVFVATTRDDERNIVASVLAKEMGAAQTISVVHQPDFASLVQKLGIDHAVAPRASFANRILKVVHQARGACLAILGEGQAEILEFTVNGNAPVLGHRLKDVRGKFPRRALVATIQRNDQVIVASGDDEILAGDSVVVIAAADAVEATQKLFGR